MKLQSRWMMVVVLCLAPGLATFGERKVISDGPKHVEGPLG